MDDYTADHLVHFSATEIVRKRPGMYVGDTTDGTGLHNWLFEALHHAVEETKSGHGDHIALTIHKDNEVSLEDHGRGIPHARFDEVFTQHPKRTSTTHSPPRLMGMYVINALSQELRVDSWRGEHWRQRYMRGETQGACTSQGHTPRTGTRLRMVADPECFTNPTLCTKTIAAHMKALSKDLPGVQLLLNDQRTGQSQAFGGFKDTLDP